MEKTSAIENIRHSLAHLLAAAVLHKFPDTKLGIGPTIENGFYYDFKFSKPITPEMLSDLEKTMRKLIHDALPFSGKKVAPAGAKKQFADQPFKLELIKEFTKGNLSRHSGTPPSLAKNINETAGQLTTYTTGDIFTDLCRGGHVKNTKEINPDAFKLTHLAGAYWRGDEKNAQLTRIYGVAFATKKELDEYLKRMEEAKKRDHKVLGRELDLFTFSDLVGAGLPLFTPKGTMIHYLLDEFVWELRKAAGYARVDIPHLAKKELYEQSGHWEKFKDDLFRIKTREGHEFAMKPMNCPHHIQIFARKQWSYRELPQRYASTTKVYRDEQTGELAGLARVRSITQDDAHVFCRKGELREEMKKIWDIVERFYGAFGFTLTSRLSLHDPKHPEKYLGTEKVWKEAEAILRKIAKEKRVKPVEAIGEAAFYGPKIDFLAEDSLGRGWQVATIQIDMNEPERFKLSCINEDGKEERIFMVHTAIMGAIERFMAVLIEHVAGKFPVWLAPVQVRILAVSDKFEDYARGVKKVLEEKDVRVELVPSNETLGKRIRQGELDKIPYTLVVGEKEMNAKTVNVRSNRGGNPTEIELEKFLEQIEREITQKSS